MAELLRRAFYYAKAENGPVQIDIPRDYFYHEGDTTIYPSITLERGPGPAHQIAQAAAALLGAKRPVIVAGGGVVQADAGEALRELAEYLAAPVVCSYLHNDAFPGRATSSRPDRSDTRAAKRRCSIIAKADVVLALGLALGAVRNAAAARDRLLAEGRERHPDRLRLPRARSREEDFARHLRRRQAQRGRVACKPSSAVEPARARRAEVVRRDRGGEARVGRRTRCDVEQGLASRSVRATRSNSSPRRCPPTAS